MELKVTVSEQATAALEERARERGYSDVNKYVERLIATDLLAASPLTKSSRPFARRFKKVRFSEGDWDALVEEAREEVYRERKAREQ